MEGDEVGRVAADVLSLPRGTLCALIAPPGHGKTAVLDAVAAVHADHCRVSSADRAGLEAALARRGWVIVDDVDPDRDRAVVDLLAEWAVQGSRQAIVVMAGRSVRLRTLLPLHERVRVLDEAQLGLGFSEAVDLLMHEAPDLTPADIESVVHACQGWPAALEAAGRWATRHPGQSVAGWLNGRGSEDIVGRLLANLPSDERDFLLETALLERLNPSLCDHVRARTDSAALLPRVEADLGLVREAGSVDPVDDPAEESSEWEWWTRHPLLTVALRRMTRGRDLTDPHQRAADWYLAAGDLASAMDHLMGAGRLREAGRVIREHEDMLLARGRAAFAHEWYDRLGPEALGSDILHLLRIGWSAALAGDRAGARLAVEQLRSRVMLAGPDVRDDPGAFGPDIDAVDLQGQVHLLTAYVALMAGDAQQTVAASRRACDAFIGRFEHNSHQTAPTLLVRGLLWCGEVEAANAEITRLSTQPFVSDVIRESLLAGVAAQTWVERGEIYRARNTAQGALDWLASQGLDPVTVGHFPAPTALALCLAELGDHASALSRLTDVADAAAGRGMIGDQVFALSARASIESATGSLTSAVASISEARQALLMAAPGSRLMMRLDTTEVGLRIMGGDVLRAARLVHELPDGNQRRLLQARIGLHRRGDSVSRLLAGIQPSSPREEAVLELLLATAALPRSRRLAHSHLARAADVAHGHGMLMLLAGSPPGLLEFASDAAREHADDALQVLVTNAVPTSAGGVTGLPQQRERVGAPVPLSPGELALLPLLPTRDSNEQLALRLGVSVNTVKTRLRRLYRKLGVASRDEAVAVARARNLLP